MSIDRLTESRSSQGVQNAMAEVICANGTAQLPRVSDNYPYPGEREESITERVRRLRGAERGYATQALWEMFRVPELGR